MFNSANQLRILCLVVFLLFSPTLYAELCLLDDQDAYESLSQESNIGFEEIFLPGGQQAAYYRPLIMVSYLWDKYVWLLDTRLMHLDNILFHIANTLLVYWLACLILKASQLQSRFAPFSAALLFGLHPVTVESVAWISGRTDVMAGTFLLLGAVFLLKFKFGGGGKYLAFSVLALIVSLFFKEVTLGFIPAIYFLFRSQNEVFEEHRNLLGFSSELSRDLIVLAGVSASAILLLMFSFEVWPVFLLGVIYYLCPDIQVMGSRKYSDWLFGYLRQMMISLLVIVAAVGLFFAIRKIAFESDIYMIPQTLDLIFQDTTHAFRTFFGAAGFYVKKFFLPVPLNLAIREIDPIYQFAGVLVFFCCLYLMRRRTLLAALFLAGVLLFVPALPLALGTVAWTAYAERYIYISSAFWSIVVVLAIARWSAVLCSRQWLVVASIVLFIGLGSVTLHRSFVWQTNSALFRDTVEKEPQFKLIRNLYMVSLILEGEYSAAREQHAIGSSLFSIVYEDYLDLNLAAILIAEGDNRKAIDLYEMIIEKSSGKSEKALINLTSHLRSLTASPDYSASDIYGRIINTSQKLYALTNDPYLLYQMGKDAISMGDTVLAYQYLSAAVAQLPRESQYSVFAGRLLHNLQPVDFANIIVHSEPQLL